MSIYSFCHWTETYSLSVLEYDNGSPKEYGESLMKKHPKKVFMTRKRGFRPRKPAHEKGKV